MQITFVLENSLKIIPAREFLKVVSMEKDASVAPNLANIIDVSNRV